MKIYLSFFLVGFAKCEYNFEIIKRVNLYLTTIVIGEKAPRTKGMKGGIFGKGYSNYMTRVEDINAKFSTVTEPSPSISLWDMDVSMIAYAYSSNLTKKVDKKRTYPPPNKKQKKDKALDEAEMMYYASPIVPNLAFDGLSSKDSNNMSADPVGAVGHKYYIQAVNDMWAIYDKNTGNLEIGPRSFASLFRNGFSANECADWGAGNPNVVYDAESKVYLMEQFTTGCWTDEGMEYNGVAQCYNCIAMIDEDSLNVQRFALPYPILNC